MRRVVAVAGLSACMAAALAGCAAGSGRRPAARTTPPPSPPAVATPPAGTPPAAPSPVQALTPAERVEAYLEARRRGDVAEARSFLAPGCRIWYDTREGEGEPLDLKDDAVGWDQELRAETTHAGLVVDGDSITGLFTERNDFYRLLGIDVWRARVTFWFDPQGLIIAELYAPLPDNPDFDAHFFPALSWASRNRPDEIASLLPGDHLVRSRETARRWRALLEQWQRERNRP